MEAPKPVNYIGWGLVLGAAVGGAAAIVLFVLTGDAIWWTVAGVGAALGLLLGAAIQASRARERERLAENAEERDHLGRRT